MKKDQFVSVHNKNLQKFATDICKASKSLSPPIMIELFKPRNEDPYNLRYVSQFNPLSVNTVYRGTERSSFLGPKIWKLLPNEIFKIRIKNWKPENCPFFWDTLLLTFSHISLDVTQKTVS